jgi:type 1 glutamine amidotransferase
MHFWPNLLPPGIITALVQTAPRSCLSQTEAAKMQGRTKSLLVLSAVLLVLPTALLAPAAAQEANPHLVVYEGTEGPGVGKHVVLIAGDHEYRSEEILPAMGRILARRLGFKSSVFFTLDDAGFIEPGSSNMAGLEALRTADLLILGLRFQDFPAQEMQHIVDYLERGGPVLGIRTSTHAFQIREGPHLKYTWNNEDPEYELGFGRQVLGETWAGHYGTNHEQSSRVLPREEEADHPILRGVSDMHVQSGGYEADPMPGSLVLAVGQVLDGMAADAPPDPAKELMPVVWTRSHEGTDGTRGRVFTTTHGASEDFLNNGFRRLLINGALWALEMEREITPTMDVKSPPTSPITCCPSFLYDSGC